MSAVIEQAPLLRPMREADVDAVMSIESAVYSHGWTKGIFLDCLRVGYSCWIMEEGDTIIGYGILTVAVGEAHILNVAIHPAAQRRGLGHQMMNHLLDLAVARGADSAFLEVRPTNQGAITLYESMGFNQAGLRRNYYPSDDGREDAVIMAKDLAKDKMK